MLPHLIIKQVRTSNYRWDEVMSKRLKHNKNSKYICKKDQLSQGPNIQQSFWWRQGALSIWSLWHSGHFPYFGITWSQSENVCIQCWENRVKISEAWGNKEKRSKPVRGRDHKEYIKISGENPGRQVVT